MAPMGLPIVTNVTLKLENVRILDFRLPKKELAKVKEFSILDLDKIV